eukprot:gb/GEZJ01006395.1/.p1 GENE.gb/GEZJ01006395.1/~~gb/GEZJ01006395.1/.p1  ORF type:complete len:425 (-),score=36.09 gb/GEZJ01006395.1/:504-1778(-)
MIRERGSKKFAKVLRFAYLLPNGLADLVKCWIAVPRSQSNRKFLFSKRTNDGKLVIPQSDATDDRDTVELHCHAHCRILTVGQRCADWFILRQFRITGTTAGATLLADANFRSDLNLPPPGSPHEDTMSKKMKRLGASWFSSARSNESMMRGTCNEQAVLNALSKKPFVLSIHECGMLADKQHSWLACSADGIARIDLAQTSFASAIGGEDNVALATVEIKTSVSSSSLNRALNNASLDLACVKVGDASVLQRIPQEHIGQVLQQMLVINTNYSIYAVSSETALLSCTLLYASNDKLRAYKDCLVSQAGPLVTWAHTDTPVVPSFVDVTTKRLLKERIVFWKLINTHVTNHDAFVPLKLFKHGIQGMYSKTKGGVDGSAQARAILRSATTKLKWEQKVVGQTLKTLFVNSCFGLEDHGKECLGG